jgi:hypothetical protein
MPLYSLHYSFRQPLRAPAKAAYAWCTAFEPGDGKLFPVKWQRSVRRLSGDALVLTDTTYPAGHPRRIHRLVRLDPSEKAWTNTHLDGPFRHSQYWYRIVSDSPRSCHLEFRGFRLVTSPRALSASEIARLTDLERRSDADLWRLRMAPALRRDLTSTRRASRSSR